MGKSVLLGTALPLVLLSTAAAGQDLQDRDVAPPPLPETSAPADSNQIQFSADVLEYDNATEIVTAGGDVRLFREGNRLRADRVVWNRQTGEVIASGEIAVTNPEGDVAYGDRIELTDTLKDGAIENMLVVLEGGGRIAAERGTRREGGAIVVEHAAYTPCPVTDRNGCPKEPSFKITADSVVYDPAAGRIRYRGAQVALFGLALPLPIFSHPIGGKASSGLLLPDVQIDRTNGLEIALPYLFLLGPDRDLLVTPHVYTETLPMLEAEYRALNSLGAFRITGYGTYSRRSDDGAGGTAPVNSSRDFRGYVDGVANFQFDDHWSMGASLRVASDRTFLRRYDITDEDRLRNNLRVERIDRDSYFSFNGWAVQTLRLNENQGGQPVALPELDYRRRLAEGWLGGRFDLQLNTLALTRPDGQDTQRAFASARWDKTLLTSLGQRLILTGFARGDLYNTHDTLATSVASYRGLNGFHTRGIAAAAAEMQWPFIGEAFGGVQRVTPRVQLVAAPKLRNLDLPNEDARAVDLEDSNLFALNRFAGYDRFEDSSRVTYGVDYALTLPGISVEANIGQSYRLSDRPVLFPDGTGLTDRFSDLVGRTVVRYRDFLAVTHRYRIDKDNLAFRRNEIDATIGTRQTYALVGYLRLDRNIEPVLEDLQDREEIRLGGRVQLARYWSAFGSTIIDLTDRHEDVLSSSDGFEPVRHRIGVAYEDECVKLGLTWKRDYEGTGDAQRGNSYQLTLVLKNLGR